ncbi:uncharacterized protein LOC143512385 [Brachyhypopomus gauderio]|uniref:uncharacterized protein LOC143512385 n=1 Tax=Brachyhypopomus gauderio TaxID=698409 RepID=UPI004042E0BE
MDRRLLDLPFTFHGICVALILIVVVDAQGLPDLCVPQAKVQKKSYITVSSKSPLKISCPVTYCEEIPTVRWIKISDMDEWTLVNETDEITITQEQSGSGLKKVTSYLNFKSISKYDSGFYRCVISAFNFLSQSHSINVSVLDGPTVPMTIYGTNSSAIVNNRLGPTTAAVSIGWLPYVFICLGILGVVTVVMVIYFLSLYECR